MQRTMLVAAVVALVALAGAGGTAVADAGAAQDDPVTIELSVTTPGGDAVAGAEATVEWDGGSTTEPTRSNGRALVDVPAGANLSISLTHDEYVKNGPHEVQGASANQVVETQMYEPSTAQVTVVDAEDSPVEGATVRLRKDGQSVFADSDRTDADGVYDSEEVETGSYTVLVREPGYYDASTSLEVDGEARTEVQIEAGDVTVDLRTQDPTPEGPGAVNATVAITTGGEDVVSATTDQQGRPVVLDVNHNYDATVTRDGYDDLVTSFRTGESDTQQTFNVTRTPSISLTTGNERVVVGENLRVEVSDEYDRPVEGATVSVGGETAAETNADGVASVEIPAEGEREVTAEYDGLSAETATVTGIASDGGSDDSTEDGATNDSDDDGGTGDGSPGFGVVAALIGALLAVGALARRS